ncbi:hypothetical protein D3C84_712230 [compost metagenome]
MLKNMIAQMKQEPRVMNQFMQGNVVLAGVNGKQQQALLDIFKGKQSAKEQVRAIFWL